MKKLYIGNLPYQASEQDLQAFFSESGVTVDSVSLVHDRDSGQARGFGFVELADGEMDRAIEATHGKQFMGRALVVNEARPRESGGGGGGGFRRPGGGGGGGRGRPSGGNRDGGGRGRSW